MLYIWQNNVPGSMDYVEEWLDEEAALPHYCGSLRQEGCQVVHGLVILFVCQRKDIGCVLNGLVLPGGQAAWGTGAQNKA